MNTLDMAKTAYSMPGTPVRTARATEYEVFARVTRALKSAESGKARSFAALAKAVHENLSLWTMLASDVADPENALPEQLRAKLFYLYEFTRQHSQKILSENASIGVLVDINAAVMRGLRGGGPEA